MNVDALRFRAAQRKAREADLHQQRIGAYRAACNDADGLAFDKTQFAQTFRDRIIAVEAGDGIHYCGGKRGEFGEVHGIFSNNNDSHYIDIPLYVAMHAMQSDGKTAFPLVRKACVTRID